MSPYEIGLVLHVLGALLFFGGALTTGIAFETARRQDRPSEVALLLGVARTGALVLAVGAALTLGTGLWLADEVDHFDDPWLQASLALFVLSIVLGGLGGQRPKKARRLATDLAARDDTMTDGLRGLVDDRVSRAANYVSSGLVLVVLVLMIWRPGD